MEPSPLLRYATVFAPQTRIVQSFGMSPREISPHYVEQLRVVYAALESSVTKSSSRPICADGNVTTSFAARAVASPYKDNRPSPRGAATPAREVKIAVSKSVFQPKRLIFQMTG
jgi:hypothetical protein